MLIAILLFGAAVGVGIFLGTYKNTPSADRGANSRSDNCDAACRQWRDRKSELCGAERTEADAKERVDLLKTVLGFIAAGMFGAIGSLLGASGLITLLTSAGVAVSVAPVLAGIILAGGILAAGAAVLVATALSTALLAASLIWWQKQQDTQDAEDAEIEARNILSASCTRDEVDACLANPPC